LEISRPAAENWRCDCADVAGTEKYLPAFPGCGDPTRGGMEGRGKGDEERGGKENGGRGWE